MVIFCLNTPPDSNPDTEGGVGLGREAGVTFRQPNENDYLGSRARKMFLVPKWEVDGGAFGGFGGAVDAEGGEGQTEGAGNQKKEVEFLRKNGTEGFRGWQEQSALGHWAVMRTVIPKEIWENW